MKIDEIEDADFTLWKAVKWFLIISIIIAGATVISSLLTTVAIVAKTPGRVIQKTLETDNVVASYEWFYDTNAAYDARLAQVIQFKNLHRSETDTGEKSRLRIDMAAIQQTCRDLATKYNANSEKMNKSIFKGWALPENLIISTCE